MVLALHHVIYPPSPTLDELVAAWRWRYEDPQSLPFTISDGSGRTERQLYVVGLRWLPGTTGPEVWIELEFMGSDARWTGIYNYDSGEGHISREPIRKPLK